MSVFTAPSLAAPPLYGIGVGAVHRAQAFLEVGNHALDEVQDTLGLARFLLHQGQADHALRLEQLDQARHAIGRLEADLINLGAEIDAEQACLDSGLVPNRELPSRFRP